MTALVYGWALGATIATIWLYVGNRRLLRINAGLIQKLQETVAFIDRVTAILHGRQLVRDSIEGQR